MARRAWWCYLVLLLAGIPVFATIHGTPQRMLFDAYGFAAATAILVALRMHRPSHRGPWLAFAAGLALFAFADVAFDIYAAAGDAVPVPSLADYLYLTGYPVLAWGMVLLVRDRVRGADLASALDGMMVAVGVGVLAWVFVMAPYAHDQTLSIAARVVPIAYPALDLLLVAVAARLLLSRGVQNPTFRLLVASVLGLVLADGLSAIATLHNTYADSNFIDIGWLLSYALWGAAALHPSMPHVTDERPSTRVRRNRVARVVLAVAALTAPALLIVQGFRGGSSDEAVLAASSAAMFALVLARLSLVTRALDVSNRQLAEAGTRQLVLTDAALAFVSTADIESAADIAVRTAVALAGTDTSWSAFVVTDPLEARVLAVAGPAPYAVTTPGGAELDAGEHGQGGSDVVTASVVVDDRKRGELLVGNSTLAADALGSTLSLVCSQMGLALQSIEAAEERLRARNERQFRSLVQNSSDVVTLIGADRTIRYQSPGVRKIIGIDSESRVGRSFGELFHPDDAASAHATLTEVLIGGLAATADFECRVAHGDGTWRELDTVMTNLLDDPDVGAVVLNSRDVTERRTLERELHRRDFRDSLTGLPNRALFFDRVTHALDRAADARPIAVLFLDIDDFKLVNDSLGHPAGDRLLIAVAERLKASIRPGDTLARFGGDEFAMLLESGDMPTAAHAVAARVAKALGAPVRIGSDDVSVRASIGIALGQSPADGTDGLLRDADLAMYMAKQNGKGRFEMFRPEMHHEAVRRLELAADLRRGIEEGQLEVFFQPIVSIRTAAPVGAEALVRWHHPTEGLVPPAEFIPIAEATGLIVPLGRWVLGEAFRQAGSWRRSGLTDDAFYVSVNVSARQLQDPALLDDVAEAIRVSGLPARAVVLEVTESIVMQDADSALARLLGLKDLGLRLAVDDFGTGYSSLSYLRNLPMDIVKIDKSFVDRITLNPEGAAMVRSVIELSHALGLVTIAEGAELEAQVEVLDELGCDSIQGYVFARPMSGGQVVETLTSLRTDAASRLHSMRQRT